MATDPFVNTQESDLRKKWALMQLQMAGEATPVRHPMQAVARALQGAMGGYMAGEAKREDDATSASAIDTILGPVTKPSADQAPAPVAPGPIPPGPSSPRVPMVQNEITSPQSAPVKDIYSANEQSPLDPVDGAITPDRARLLAAIQAGESGGRPNVMYGGKTFDSYADHPRVANPIMSGPNAGMVSSAAGLNQMIAPTWDRAKNALNLQDFSPGNQNAAGAYIAGEDYKKRTGQSLDLALSQAGNDPARIAAIGRALSPTWTSLPGGIEPNQQTNQFVQNMQRPAPGGESPGIDMASAQSRVPGQQPSLVQGQPPSGNATSRSPVNVPPEMADTIRKLGANPATRAKAWELLMKYAKPVDRVEAMTPAQRKQWNVPDGMSAGIETVTGKPVFSPPQTNVNLNTAQKGQEVMATESAQDFKNAQAAGREAAKRAQVWDTMEKASKGFSPGATASTALEAKRYLRDMGIIKGDDVPDAEVFKQMQQQLAIHAQPKGQGAVSNFERDMYAKSIANMDMSPEALSRAIQTGRKLDDFDRKVAQIYRDNARKNGGVPDSITINEEIDKLGSPLSPAEINYLRRTSEGAAAPAAGGAQPQSGAPVRKFNPATGKIE